MKSCLLSILEGFLIEILGSTCFFLKTSFIFKETIVVNDHLIIALLNQDG